MSLFYFLLYVYNKNVRAIVGGLFVTYLEKIDTNSSTNAK